MYKAKVSGWQGYDVCSLDISVGQNYHQGAKFEAAIEWINKKPFQRCIINVADTLQRHNFSDQADPHGYARQLGQAWLEDHMDAINRLQCDHAIIRWDEWLNHHDFPKHANWVEQKYRTDTFFRDAVEQHVVEFTAKSSARDPVASRAYLLEEFAVQRLMDQSIGPYLMLYPSNRLEAERMIAESGFARLKFHKRVTPPCRTIEQDNQQSSPKRRQNER